jgi:NAD(P)-dependent dehydrogenase (short-subunit alcohol dehydrogenase family)
VVGIFRFCRAVTKVMEKAGGGRIVNIACGAACKDVPQRLHYVSSKGAVLALTKSMAKEVGAAIDLRSAPSDALEICATGAT